MDDLIVIVLGIVSSLLSSSIFWLLTFKITRTDIMFSDIIKKTKSMGEYSGTYRYRVKLINSGSRDLTEVQFIVKLSIKSKKVNGINAINYSYLGLGNENKLPLLRGKAYQCKHSTLRCAHVLTSK